MSLRTHFATRRRFLASLAAALGIFGVEARYAIARPLEPSGLPAPRPDVFEQVIPQAGVPAGFAFKESIQKMIAAGVIDPDKFRASPKELPAWVERLLVAPSDDVVVFTEATAPYLIDLLWPLGLSNKAALNADSPLNTPRIPVYASTGGWTLGRQPNGYVHFNQVDAVRMTAEQQQLVLLVARTVYRPCCNNSTFFQDCNHGSAMLGLLELAASQGAGLEGLYKLALTANSYWFPEHYAKTALYFAHFRRRSWRNIDPKLVLGAAFSSASGWQQNVNYPLRRANVTLPSTSNGQQGC